MCVCVCVCWDKKKEGVGTAHSSLQLQKNPVGTFIAVTGTPRCSSRLAVKRKQCHEVQSLPWSLRGMPKCYCRYKGWAGGCESGDP